MPGLAAHHVQLGIFLGIFGLVTLLGFAAMRWRPPETSYDLEQWGLGGRAFGNWVTWFLLGGDVYTAYTFVAVPALVFTAGAAGYFAVPYVVMAYPLIYVVLVRLWSVAHAHGFVTPAEFVRGRFGSRTLSASVAVVGIVGTMPYIALQLVGLEAVLKVMGLTGPWPLTLAFAVLALYTFRSGLRAPALIAIVKDVLVLWTVLTALIAVAMIGDGWHGVFHAAATAYAQHPAAGGGLLLAPARQLSYVTLAVGSALTLFLYPHNLTGALAARNRATVKRNVAALPVYSLVLGLVALLGFVAVYSGVKPLGGDGNTIMPELFDAIFPRWAAGLAFAAIGVAALVPAAVMSIAAANLFTRSIYREFLRPHASAAEETRVSKAASLTVKLGAVVAILFLNPQFSIDLQLIGGVFVLQTLPAVAIGLYTAWLHRWALVVGLLAGLGTGLVLLYQIPRLASDGTVIRSHFGGSGWPVDPHGLQTGHTIYVGLIALAVNLVVAAAGTPVLRYLGVPAGRDITTPRDYVTDEGDPIDRMAELVDGTVGHRPAHTR